MLNVLCRADVDEQAKKEVKDLLIAFDRTLLVADPRQCEPKKYVYLICHETHLKARNPRSYTLSFSGFLAVFADS